MDNTFTLYMNNAVSFYMDNVLMNFDVEITGVLNLAHLYGSNTIALIPDSATGAVFDLSSININYDYWGTN